MRERGLVDIDKVNSKSSPPLVERMDPAIGEASTVMGAMMTELMRRTLRGGVTKIGEELEDYVAERVDVTITERKPVLEQLAVEAADKSARAAATEVAVVEVRALETRTQEADQGLAERIVEAEKKSHEVVQQTAQELGGQIAEAEKRVGNAVRTEMNGQVIHILERARKGSLALRARLKALSAQVIEVQQQAAALQKQLEQVNAERHAAESVLRQELTQGRTDDQAQWRREIEQLVQADQALVARVAELEKPRGLRALWARLRRLFRRQPAE